MPSNYKVAEQRIKSLQKRFEANPSLKEKYKEAMTEYIDNEFAELVPSEEIHITKPGIYYMPHHAVIKEDRNTTKTRIVFNASSSINNSKSLNDMLLIGSL